MVDNRCDIDLVHAIIYDLFMDNHALGAADYNFAFLDLLSYMGPVFILDFENNFYLYAYHGGDYGTLDRLFVDSSSLDLFGHMQFEVD